MSTNRLSVSISLPPALVLAVDELAAHYRRPRSWVIQILVKQAHTRLKIDKRLYGRSSEEEERPR